MRICSVGWDLSVLNLARWKRESSRWREQQRHRLSGGGAQHEGLVEAGVVQQEGSVEVGWGWRQTEKVPQVNNWKPSILRSEGVDHLWGSGVRWRGSFCLHVGQCVLDTVQNNNFLVLLLSKDWVSEWWSMQSDLCSLLSPGGSPLSWFCKAGARF